MKCNRINMWCVVITAVCFITVGVVCFIPSGKNPPAEETNKPPQTAEAEADKPTPADKTAPASTPHSKTEKYILSYDEKSDMVVIITVRNDGSQIISPVESIMPDYLTAEDIQELTKGMEFTTKEDLYVQIEDFSS